MEAEAPAAQDESREVLAERASAGADAAFLAGLGGSGLEWMFFSQMAWVESLQCFAGLEMLRVLFTKSFIKTKWEVEQNLLDGLGDDRTFRIAHGFAQESLHACYQSLCLTDERSKHSTKASENTMLDEQSAFTKHLFQSSDLFQFFWIL